ncbi:high mobility group protein 2 [Musca autumnalis]|uniref:high mobility group protein 2 n=1 Tax=Musca autumnalis TaxID=221902 RepID=UPI003CFA5C2E
MDGSQETIEQIQAEVEAMQKEVQQEKEKNIETTETRTAQQPTEQSQEQAQIATSIPASTPPKHIEVDEDDDDEEDFDEDEEKDNSQKLVMDLEEEEEEEEEDEVEDLENDVQEVANDGNDDNIQQDEKQKEPTSETVGDKNTKSSAAVAREDEAITLSDAEEVPNVPEGNSKPGKVQKRKSVGATTTASNNEEERYRLKRRKINAEGAPKMPLTGYVRYMNDRREAVRKDNPNKNSIEVTKVIAEEWQSLSSDIKSEYLKAAEVDKQRYLSELHTFLKSRPDILASELAKNKTRKSDAGTSNAAATTKSSGNKDKGQTSNDNVKSSKESGKEKPTTKESQSSTTTSSSQNSEKQLDKNRRSRRTPTPPFNSNNASSSTSAATSVTGSAAPSTSAAASSSSSATTITNITHAPGEIPIFTTEFLEHNKICDMELRSLRKSKTDLEQQNFVLEKHVENMKSGVEKMQTENNELQEKNRLLEIYLDKLKRKLAQALSALPLPSAPNGATVENIDKYMQDLYKMSTSNSHGPATLNKAKDIIRKLDLQIQL